MSERHCDDSLITFVSAEDDSSLTADDKAIARFQKQRLKEFTGTDLLQQTVLNTLI